MSGGGEKLPLSVAIITKNEEERLADCLASVAFADDVVVVDAESHDRTQEIAKNAGARLFVEPWRGFGPQKQFAIDQCRHLWVLVLDADERIPPETVVEITTLLGGEPMHVAYSLPRKNFFSGRWIRHAGWWPDRVVRLFRKDCNRMSAHLVHESIQVGGSVGELVNPIVHLTNRNLRQTMDKVNHYSTAGAEEMFACGETASIFKAVARGGWAFLYNYLFRLGFLDGGQGLVIACTDGINKFLKYAKLHEMHSRRDKG
ncbi:MAG: glycosyltransferase family 2 protein [Desulfobulbaceae bacterium]|nr:glycosyltransferase family 2 protein [Desulfobulbaceae bacterium]